MSALSDADCLPGLQSAMGLRPDVAQEAGKGLRNLFAEDNAPLIEAALRTGFVEFLLGQLASPLPDCPNPPAVKAELVKTLKAMSVNLEHGERVSDQDWYQYHC